VNHLPAFLLERRSSHPPERVKGAVSIPFLEKGVHRLSDIVRSGYAHWELSRRDGLLQQIDARVKVVFLALFLVIVSLKRAIAPEAGIAAFVSLLFAFSHLEVLVVYKRILAFGFIFGILVPFPFLFNLLSDGALLFPVIRLARSYDLWTYHVPAVIGVTREGVEGVALLFFRVTNSLALSLLVLYTTPFTDIAKALRILRVPDTFIIIITLSYKYMLLFTRTVEDMHLAKKSRLLGAVRGREARSWVAERITFLYRKTHAQCGEIFKAMVSRGFTGEVRLHGLRKMAAWDWWMAAAQLGIGLLFLGW
jgi:cobalt/nickel transport system permease protein